MGTLDGLIGENRGCIGFFIKIPALTVIISAFILPTNLSLLGANTMTLETNRVTAETNLHDNKLIDTFKAFQLDVIFKENLGWKFKSSDFDITSDKNQQYIFITPNRSAITNNSRTQLVDVIMLGEGLSKRGLFVTIDGTSSQNPKIRVKIKSRLGISS